MTEVKGIDISSRMIEAAIRKTGEGNIKNVGFMQSTLFDERLKRESYDVILAFNILHFFKDTNEVIKRLYELLKPGGFVISVTACIGEMSLSGVLQYMFFSPFIKLGVIPYIKFLKTSELERLMTDINLRIIETERLNNSPTNYFIVAKKV